MAHWILVYDLHEDKRQIRLAQEATLNTDQGLKPTHGLMGSDQWWEAIGRGEIPAMVLEGTIARVYMSGHNDYPEFEVLSDSGKTKWTRVGDDRYYQVGKRVRVTYVLQEFKRRLPMLPFDQVVLSVEIET